MYLLLNQETVMSYPPAAENSGLPNSYPGYVFQTNPPPYGVPAPPSSTPPYSTPPYGTPPYGTPPSSTPPYSTPPYGTPPSSTPPYSTPPYGTPPSSTRLEYDKLEYTTKQWVLRSWIMLPLGPFAAYLWWTGWKYGKKNELTRATQYMKQARKCVFAENVVVGAAICFYVIYRIFYFN